MALDLERLLAPVSEDNPVGEDLAYDDDRQTIESAFEKSASGEASGGEIDWRQIISLIEKQAERTKDIWLAVYLARAGARSGQLAVVETGAQFLAGLFEDYWADVHPQLDEYGFQGRKGPCEALTRLGDFLTPLRNTVLISHPRLGSYTGADFERFESGGDGEDGYGLFRAAMAETSQEDLQAAIDHLDRIRDGIRRADAALTANADSDTATNFQPTYDTIAQVRRAIASFSTAESEAATATAADVGGAATPTQSAGGKRISGQIESRDDVIKTIDLIADYYRRHEPSSPVPLALRRAREWVTLDFLTLLEDIAPGSLDDARGVLMSNLDKAEEE